MKKLDKRIKRDKNLNDIAFNFDMEDGSMPHVYVITKSDDPEWIHLKENGPLCTITFQKGKRYSTESVHGVTESDLLEIVRLRLHSTNIEDMNFEIGYAIQHVEEALMWLRKVVEEKGELGERSTQTRSHFSPYPEI